jgi:hypothetical protein
VNRQVQVGERAERAELPDRVSRDQLGRIFVPLLVEVAEAHGVLTCSGAMCAHPLMNAAAASAIQNAP